MTPSSPPPAGGCSPTPNGDFPKRCWLGRVARIHGPGPGLRRPVIVIQGDALNRSRLATAVCVPLTSNLRWANAPGNVLLTAAMTGLPRDSGANVSQIIALDQSLLEERTGRITSAKVDLLLAGIDVVLGR